MAERIIVPMILYIPGFLCEDMKSPETGGKNFIQFRVMSRLFLIFDTEKISRYVRFRRRKKI